MKDGVLMRKWRPPTVPASHEWSVIYQIVVPQKYRSTVLSLAHDTPMAGHLGVSKTHRRVLNHFYWPGISRDVKKFCKSCHTCQVVGKANQKPKVAPLKPIPVAKEPFSHVIIDCVGPLPKTKKGNQYLLTIMCGSTRFPEAIPLRNIKTPPPDCEGISQVFYALWSPPCCAIGPRLQFHVRTFSGDVPVRY